MIAQLLAQVGPGDRIQAVHEHFSERSSGGLAVLYATLIIAVLLCGVLLLLNRIQVAKQRREERVQAQRRQELKRRQPQGMQLTPQMSLLKDRQPARR